MRELNLLNISFKNVIAQHFYIKFMFKIFSVPDLHLYLQNPSLIKNENKQFELFFYNVFDK